MTPETAAAAVGAPRATAREFVAVLFRRRWIVVGLFATVMVAVLYAAFSRPETYVSTGQVLVRRGEAQSTMQPLRAVTSDWEIEIGSEIQTARSWPVVKAAQKILDAERGQPRLELDPDRVDAQVTGKTNVISIGYRDRRPRVVERACDALLRAYIDYRQNSQLAYPERFFDGEISRASAELERWSQRRREFAERTGIVDLQGERATLIGLRSGLAQRRVELSGSLAESESADRLMTQLRQDSSMEAPNLLLSSTNDAAIDIAKQHLIEQKARIARLHEVYRDDAPMVTAAQATLDTLRTLLDRELRGRFAATRSRVRIQRADLEVTDRDIASIDGKLARMAQLESESAEIDRQISVWQQRYTELAKSSDQSRVNTNTVPRIWVYLLNPASPAKLENAHDYVRLALAPAFSLVVGIGLAFFVDGLDLTVHTAGQAEEEVRLPVLATVTDRRRETWRPLARASGTGSA